jgi:UDP-N-acetylglucosamine acyltransferase
MSIHPSVFIDPTAQIGENVIIGPNSYIGPHCIVGDDCEIGPNAVLQRYVEMGKQCKVSPAVVLGGDPQDMKFKGEVSYVKIGDNNLIREGATINRASGEGLSTILGDGCMLMAYSHMGHNSRLGNEVILANAAQLGGYVTVDDYAFISATCIVHQFARVGKLTMIGGGSGVRQDAPPFSLSFGMPLELYSINKIGLRRRGYDLHARTQIKKAYQLLLTSGLNYTQALAAIEAELENTPYIQELVTFFRSSQRGVSKPARSLRTKSSDASDSDNEALLAEIL